MPWCIGGHEVDEGQKFCIVCGEPPLEACSEGHPINKWNTSPGGEPIRPNFCPVCSVEYPWYAG